MDIYKHIMTTNNNKISPYTKGDLKKQKITKIKQYGNTLMNYSTNI